MAAVTRAAPLARRCAHDAARVGACRLLRRASSSRAGTPPGVPVPAASARFAPTIAALLGMLNSCASGVAVVNIDNGFGAGFLASQINRL